MTNQLLPAPVFPSSAGAAAVFLRDVLDGLSQPHKRLPCKYFYDPAGGELFERICQLDEYYPTRCELAILERNASDMAKQLGEGVALIEYGSGSSRKTCLLLDRLREPAAYLPVDINGEQLQQTADNLSRLVSPAGSASGGGGLHTPVHASRARSPAVSPRGLFFGIDHRQL